MNIGQKYCRNESGNIGLIFALTLGILLTAMGAAVDMGHLASTRTKTADLSDTMALAAAIAASEGRTKAERTELAQAAALALFEVNRGAINASTVLTPIIDVDDTAKDINVTVKADVNHFIMGMFGQPSSTVSAQASVSYKVETVVPISMAFAFDTSGSMSAIADGEVSKTRMDVLQEATGLLFEAMESEAIDPDLMKAAFSTTFSSYSKKIVDSEDWSYGEDSISEIIDSVNAMTPGGGTNSTPAMQYAYDQLVTNRPIQDPRWQGYVLFMTDGANGRRAVNNPATLELCEALRNDPAINVITVAFSAPKSGQELLEACATPGKYYESKNAEQIKDDFAEIGRNIGELVFRLKS